MSDNDRRASVSSSEQQRTASRSSTRSHGTSSNTIAHPSDAPQGKIPSRTKKRSDQEKESTQRSESLTSTQSTIAPSLSSKKKRASVKTTSLLRVNPRSKQKRKKSSLNVSEHERKRLIEANDAEQQNLTGFGISIVPVEIFGLVTLRRLILSNNNLACLSSRISSLVNLEYLDVSHNPLMVKNGHDDYSCFPRECCYLRNLQTLIMAECSLKHIPVAVWSIVSLQTLDLSRNKIGFLMKEIGNLVDIRHLRLSYMNLDTLPPEIAFCDKLETLDMIGNPIDNLPDTLVECRQLHDLKINYKTFYKVLDSYMLKLIDEGKIRSEHIPQVIFELENLQILDLSRTKINAVSNQQTLNNLTELYLLHNSFFDIPESVCRIKQLKLLDMSHNRLQTIPEYIDKMKQVETLILSYNNLSSVSRFFARLVTLRRLVLSHNHVEVIDEELSQSQSLRTLDLSSNSLTAIPEELCGLKQLETLDLRSNLIECLPLAMRRMTGLKSMNMFDDDFQRTGLHVLGNAITEPPSHVWKSTDIQLLFSYIDQKQKDLTQSFYHLKLILLGPKNIGKTTLATKLVNNPERVTTARKTLDSFVSLLQHRQESHGRQDKQRSLHRSKSSAVASSTASDQWIENRISTNDDDLRSRPSKARRSHPPPLKTYRSSETTDYVMHKSTFITKNNLYCTIIDVTSEASFEILHPLIYDSNALYLLPVNVTHLLNVVRMASSVETTHRVNDSAVHIDTLLTNEWLYHHVYRYIESLSDHSEQVSVAVLGLVDRSKIVSNGHGHDRQQQQLLDGIHSRVKAYLVLQAKTHRDNIELYSEFFPRVLRLDDEPMSSFVIEQLETIAQQWKRLHHKEKRASVRRRLGFEQDDALVINYSTCLKLFEQQTAATSDRRPNDEGEKMNRSVVEELNQMNFDQCLDYLKLIGDILCVGHKPQITILIKPYYFLNEILARTVFRPRIDQWLNYEENMIFRFSGCYLTEQLFAIDRERLLKRGEFTWNILSILFYEQHYDHLDLTEQTIVDYCRLIERLQLGYVNPSNLRYHEFATAYFVCPWLMKENSTDIEPRMYFRSLEQSRQYEILLCERARRIKQQQLWSSMDKENLHGDALFSFTPVTKTSAAIPISDLPSVDEISIPDAQIISLGSIRTIKILNENASALPYGLYERLLICLHALFYERLDYRNITVGRTTEKSLIKTERFEEHHRIHVTLNSDLLPRIEHILVHSLFSFYPKVKLRIET